MNFLYLFLVIILIILQNPITLQNPEENYNGQCSVENKNECQSKDTQEPLKKYQEEYNSIFRDIEKAKKKYIPCSTELDDLKCECNAEVIRQDLAVFKEKGISRQMLEDAASYGTRYKIYKQKLYRESNCMFPSRCEGIEYFILKLLPTLPDMDFVVNTRDYPQVHYKFGTQLKPVFSFSKTAEYLDITYPAWTFWAGGPAIALHPTGIGRWDLQREKLKKASIKLPWHEKVSKAFFRGSRTSDERDSLVLLSRRKPNLVNAQYTKNQAWKSPKDTLNAEPAKEVSFEDHCQYKYLFNFRGVAASFRFKHLFLCKSLVFHVGDEWLEFFYPSMKPWIHYVPLKKYPSENDIENILEFFQTHDKLAKDIADNGYDFIWHHLRMQDIECYWRKLLKNYAKLLKFKVEEDDNMIFVKAKSKMY